MHCSFSCVPAYIQGVFIYYILCTYLKEQDRVFLFVCPGMQNVCQTQTQYCFLVILNFSVAFIPINRYQKAISTGIYDSEYVETLELFSVEEHCVSRSAVL